MRCSCGARYFVFTGACVFGRVLECAREKAEKSGRIFIDARQTPFMNCACGRALDFTTNDAGVLGLLIS